MAAAVVEKSQSNGDLFRHHISLCEGHLKMLDMVHKHTIEGSGDWKAITPMLERAREILHASKDIARAFIPPRDQYQQVPLGASSESVYPGYSLTNIQYGIVSTELGKNMQDLKRSGGETATSKLAPEMQATVLSKKRKRPLAEVKADFAKKPRSAGILRALEAGAPPTSSTTTTTTPSVSIETPSATTGTATPPTLTGADAYAARAAMSNGSKKESKAAHKAKKVNGVAKSNGDTASKADKPLFVIDTKPTPVTIPPNLNKKTTINLKRAPSPAQLVDAATEKTEPGKDEDSTLEPKSKKRRIKELTKAFEERIPLIYSRTNPTTTNGISPEDTTSKDPTKQQEAQRAAWETLKSEIKIEFEDISAEVDRRLAAKEAKRARKDAKAKRRGEILEKEIGIFDFAEGEVSTDEEHRDIRESGGGIREKLKKGKRKRSKRQEAKRVEMGNGVEGSSAGGNNDGKEDGERAAGIGVDVEEDVEESDEERKKKKRRKSEKSAEELLEKQEKKKAKKAKKSKI
ncbi:hypothetical protein MMC25_004881 [Agyrium rufum]|nr:hypothetical protein [Agyrium rufum]